MPSGLLLGLLLAGGVSLLAVRAGALTPGAAATSTALGALIFTAGGAVWAAVVATFFATSSILSQRQADPAVPETIVAGTSRRNTNQVLANGGLPLLWALMELARPHALWGVLFAAAMAAATADTWSTEIGRRSASMPRDILTGRPVRPGTSGGVTLLGLIGGLAGTSLIAYVFVSLGPRDAGLIPLITLAGFGGALTDSIIGSSVQERRWCPACRAETEQSVHAPCATPTTHLRGRPGLDNDRVNFLATLAGSGLAGLLLLGRGAL